MTISSFAVHFACKARDAKIDKRTVPNRPLENDIGEFGPSPPEGPEGPTSAQFSLRLPA